MANGTTRVIFSLVDGRKRALGLAVGLLPVLLLLGPGGMLDIAWMWLAVPVLLGLPTLAASYTVGVDFDRDTGTMIRWRGFGRPLWRRPPLVVSKFDALAVYEHVWRNGERSYTLRMVLDGVFDGLEDGATLHGSRHVDMLEDGGRRLAVASGMPYRGVVKEEDRRRPGSDLEKL